MDSFASFNSDDAGEIAVEIALNHSVINASRPSDTRFPPKQFSFEPNIVCLTLIPGLSSQVLISLIDTGCKGIIVRSYGSGDIPQDLFPALSYAKEKKVPVVNTTQCRGSTLMGMNEVGRLALDFGVIQAFDMSMESMSTKLMWLIGQEYGYEEIARLMQVNLVGEIDSEKYSGA